MRNIKIIIKVISEFKKKKDHSAFPVRVFNAVQTEITKIIYFTFAVGRNSVQWMFLRT